MRRHRRQTRRTWQSRMRQNLLKAMPEKHLLRRKNPRERHRNPQKLMQRARQRQALSNLLTAMRRELRPRRETPEVLEAALKRGTLGKTGKTTAPVMTITMDIIERMEK